MNDILIDTPPAISRDVQAEVDLRGIAIDQVGIRGVRYPILLAGEAGVQPSIATWGLTVGLGEDQRGTHMSRFVETLEAWADTPLDATCLLAVLADVRDRLGASSAEATCAFTLFLKRRAPVSGLRARHGIDCAYSASSANHAAETVDLQVRVPITTLCPCSKEISEYGAHNQRGYVQITARGAASLSFAELVAVAERSGSAVVYPLLKRIDERHVTMQAYDTPAFVEDVVRETALGLIADPRVQRFVVEAENHESIHDHAAVATVTWERL